MVMKYTKRGIRTHTMEHDLAIKRNAGPTGDYTAPMNFANAAKRRKPDMRVILQTGRSSQQREADSGCQGLGVGAGVRGSGQ